MGLDLSGNAWKPDSEKMGSTDTGDYFPDVRMTEKDRPLMVALHDDQIAKVLTRFSWIASCAVLCFRASFRSMMPRSSSVME
jgi:hypothetical protein